MNLVIAFALTFSVQVNGVWVERQMTGTIVQAVVSCKHGLAKYRAELGARPGARFETFACMESWRNADGTPYARPA